MERFGEADLVRTEVLKAQGDEKCDAVVVALIGRQRIRVYEGTPY